MSPEELRIVDSLRTYSDLPDAAWNSLRAEVVAKGVAGSSTTARRALATAMLNAQAVAKGDFPGHPFRGNQWTDASGASRNSASGALARVRSAGKSAKALLTKRPTPIRVKTVDEAIRRMAKGEVVELADERDVNTLLEKLHDEAVKAKDAGKDFKINLCNVSVSGTNVFCGEAIGDEDGNPIERVKMPQLSGRAVPGSKAAEIAGEDGEADAGPAFLKFLESNGVKVTEESVPAASLKASQSELVGAKVAGIMKAGKWDSGVVYVSSDGYVIDGHHRWAAAVGADAKDGLGDLKLKVVRVDMSISEALIVANAFTDEFGIGKKAA